VADANGFDDPQEPAEERAFDYARTVALSDGVFAIALTLLVLNITVPALASDQHNQLGHKLLDRHSELVSYGVSFAVIALLWVRHHVMFRGLSRIDTRLTVLNLAYLGLVAFLPYPTRVLGLYGDEPAAVILYSATVALITTLAALTRIHAARAQLLTAEGRRELGRREHWLAAPAVFAISIPIAFASTTIAQLSWLLLLVHGRLRGRLARSPPYS
jgi:uncharacterized membrane protein